MWSIVICLIFSRKIYSFVLWKNVQGNDEKDNCNFDDKTDGDGVDNTDDNGDDNGDDDRAGGEEDVNQETKQEQVAVQLGPSRGLWQYSISTLDDECDDDEEVDGEERNEKQYYCSKIED